MDAMDSNKGKIAIATIILYVLVFSYAVFTTTAGTALESLIREFRLSLGNGGVFNLLQYGGSVCGLLASGYLLNRFGKRQLVLACYAVFTCSLALLTLVLSLPGFLFLLFWLGAGHRALDSVVNVTVSMLHPRERGKYISLLHCSFGIGALAGPILMRSLLENSYTWRQIYLFLGAVCGVLLLIAAVFLRGGDLSQKPVCQPKKMSKAILTDPRMICLTTVLFFFCGHQAGINNWMTYYLSNELHAAPYAASLAISVLWVGVIASRLLSSVIGQRAGYGNILMYGCAGSTVILLIGILSRNVAVVLIAIGLAGFFAGATTPMAVSIGYAWHPEAQGIASQNLFLSMSFGEMVIPWLMGRVSARWGLQVGMVVDIVFLFVAFLAAAAIPILERRGSGLPSERTME